MVLRPGLRLIPRWEPSRTTSARSASSSGTRAGRSPAARDPRRLNPPWPAVLVLLAFAAVAYGYPIRVKEALLVRELGPEYAAYMKETTRLIPFLP